MDTGCLTVAGLNRPIYLGMLYDCRDHSFLPGVTLWSKVELVLSDSKDDRDKSLDINADLSLSLMAGLIHVSALLTIQPCKIASMILPESLWTVWSTKPGITPSF